MTGSYRTNELGIAAFLKALGHRLVGVRPEGRLVAFVFDQDAAMDVDSYFAGAELPATQLFEAHRHLRALIQQLKQHSYQQHSYQRIGTYSGGNSNNNNSSNN